MEQNFISEGNSQNQNQFLNQNQNLKDIEIYLKKEGERNLEKI